eukprot:CAMPEP_0195309076 /NCGR_PEP_ID=MMETSP0707-20130614/38556_1 /TAXON_ID=33640 /ORGANISM="Asterionellopsis glacialis, Strain CCMP134" /LENGTH=468 /DNA_ID=CAMNT_0040373371 /DNA_START=40 /DNA_END=1446 /DNA_ORIENTATION=-
MTIPKVLVLVASGPDGDNLMSSAHSLCSTLSSKFALTNTSIRAATIPLERLLTANDAESNVPLLFVLFGGGSASSLASLLEREASVPFMCMEDVGEDNTTYNAYQIAKWCSLASPEVRRLVQQTSREMRQARLVEDAQIHTKCPKYEQAIAMCFDNDGMVTGDRVEGKNLPEKARGKVRDRYAGETKLALVTTDRQSGFDRMLASVPYKGAVLNLTSAFWFEKTKHIINNHILDVPHPYVSVVKKCKPFPIEFVVRSYMTGSTSTSIWKNYQNGVRNYCGHVLPEGMKKNQKLWANILTPTTKEAVDRPISAEGVISEEWMTQEDWDVCADAALKVFALGQKVAAEHGLILVDTKFEFGRDEATNEILLIDEVMTPDSSRYWLASSYEERIAQGKEPENIDKEFLRLWFRDNCDPYKDEVIPDAPRDLVLELSRRYISLYEMITWKDFDFEHGGQEEDIAEAIESSLV